MSWYVEALKKYAVFSGRARRKEYWMFVLFNIIITIVLSIVDRMLKLDNVLSAIYSLVLIIPGISVSVRRLHDIGKRGWWYFISYIPLIGQIWFIILMCTDSQYGENMYGLNPKGIN